ncbi:hypothetical protein CTI12_AA108320 [Artemisia annua]|uniref:Uncharacterized protein n=1 Tax=Artemisia annua TaxID=35608 RepID=A0A2U1PVF9_ARTAN|nr:hypothetical protein CTI12_AA108320 [Artemisia annua]
MKGILEVGNQEEGERRSPHVTEADDIRMSMFSFDRDDYGGHSMKSSEVGEGAGEEAEEGDVAELANTCP